ncbi:tumor necrosis factor b (TNF superfamily, member 2) [Gouania willdenowi]|uniref:tumor necrosis factor b (TNF superfamily, member 2) n=1 Tax=Gouania willdenowi TaxID=441366 RepID=UPI0010568C86|nr:tumor necrosis factor-like [Gouania willdenowi]
MVGYSDVDVECGPEERQRTVVMVERSSSSGWIWKASLVLVLVLLCFGLLFFTWTWRRSSDMMTLSSQTQTETSEKSDLHLTLSQIGNRATAAIHLEGSYDEEGEIQNEQLEWRNGEGQAFAQGGFQLKNNRIVIPESGLYFVYSQASYRVSCSGEGGASKGFTSLSHRIWRHSDSVGNKVTLMSAVRSACQSLAQDHVLRDNQGWYNAIYLGAVFQLNKDDELWTETTQLSQLDTDEGKTFFGVFAL